MLERSGCQGFPQVMRSFAPFGFLQESLAISKM
jgi:hypothetical protein